MGQRQGWDDRGLAACGWKPLWADTSIVDVTIVNILLVLMVVINTGLTARPAFLCRLFLAPLRAAGAPGKNRVEAYPRPSTPSVGLEAAPPGLCPGMEKAGPGARLWSLDLFRDHHDRGN